MLLKQMSPFTHLAHLTCFELQITKTMITGRTRERLIRSVCGSVKVEFLVSVIQFVEKG